MAAKLVEKRAKFVSQAKSTGPLLQRHSLNIHTSLAVHQHSSNAMERKIRSVINILKEMAPEKNEHLTLIFILNGSQLEKSTLVGCKIKMEVHLFNRDAHEKDTTSKNY